MIQAIASGRDAAIEIDRYLGGDGDISETLAPEQHADPHIGCVEGFGYKERKASGVLPAEERKDNFDMVDHGICDSDICGEASRCLQCDLRLKIHPSRLWTEYSNQKEA